MMLSGVFMMVSSGRATSTPRTIMAREESMVRVMLLPMVMERRSRSRAPKYWETMMPAPVEMPTKKTSSRFRMGPALPTAARALSPT